MKEIIIDTDIPNVKLVQRANNGSLETLRQITSTTGEIASQINDADTIETITITRTTLNTIS